jgi:predicted amidohydrolase
MMADMRPDDPALGPTSITIGCANFASVPRDKAATLEKIDRVVTEAAEQACDLVILPELALDSWGACPDCASAGSPCAWHRDEAEAADGPACRDIIDMAAARGVHVIYGFAEQGDAGALHNSANVVSPDGLVGTYRKLHLGIPLETDRFTPGDALPVFDTDLGPIGISICYDFYQGPELSRVLALKGARLLVNPTGRSDMPRAREHLEQVTLVRAHENLVAAASANRVGDAHGDPTWAGGSVIAAPAFPGFPVTLARAGTDEQVVSARVDFTEIGKWYDLLPWREWRAGPQAPISRLVADELGAIAVRDGAAMSSARATGRT